MKEILLTCLFYTLFCLNLWSGTRKLLISFLFERLFIFKSIPSKISFLPKHIKKKSLWGISPFLSPLSRNLSSDWQKNGNWKCFTINNLTHLSNHNIVCHRYTLTHFWKSTLTWTCTRSFRILSTELLILFSHKWCYIIQC